MPRRPKRKIHVNYSKNFVVPYKKIKSDTSTNLYKNSTMPMYSFNANNPEVLKSPVKSLNDKKEYK